MSMPAEKLEQKQSGYDLTVAFMILRDAIQEAGGELTPELESRWDELINQIFKKQNAYVWVLNNLDARIASYQGEIQLHKNRILDLENKKKARENDKDRLKVTAVELAEFTGVLPEVDGYTVYLQEFKSVNDNATFETVPDRYKKVLALIALDCPPEFIRQVTSRTIDKSLIKSDYKGGEEELGKFIKKKNQIMVR